MGELELAGIAARLYALPFDDFVAARTAAAKEVAASAPGKGAAAKEHRSLAADVRSLPKPSVAAWAVNMLAAHQPETLTELAALGQTMRAAQAALDAAELRRLAHQRRQLLASAVRDAQTVAEQHGRKISGAIASEVEETLRAATADEGAAAAAQSGRLLRGLSADGVDVVELAGAVALPSIAGPAVAGIASTGTSPSTAQGRTKAAKQPAQAAMPAAQATQQAIRQTTKQPTQPRLRAVREAPRAATPSVLERARAAFTAAEEYAREAAEDALRSGQELDETRALTSELAEAARSLRKQLEQTELDLKSARKRQELLAAQAQQAVRAADRARRQEDLARERVLRLGNTPD
ncbi:chromosome segregation ATPase [Arthrobacter sp. V4I6]|uniref:hypothetical protein n=1 Tax=unclassified Arthrobacter TaxID=235627 RepID=UPI002787B192|nr:MULTISPECIES: hypothetical protein [unclassified Arthrobacter]MDQ0822750.1 hypothetical protein [Arthrobacter sp. V1I7]MDQ0852378.1 chromosome segregation ATPase [Arthrobacter sp. V4I6]